MIRMRTADKRRSFQAWLLGFPALRLRHGSLLPVRLRSVLPAADCPVAGPFFARIGCGRAPVSAGAVRAPDCARARDGRTQGAPLLSVPQIFFRAGAKRKAKRPRADAASFLRPNLVTEFQESRILCVYIPKYENKYRHSFPPPCKCPQNRISGRGRQSRILRAASSGSRWRNSGPNWSSDGQPIWAITLSISSRRMSTALTAPAAPPATAP